MRKLPIDDYVAPEALVRVVDAFVASLDLGSLGFDRTIAANTGRPGYHPSDMLRLYIWGYLYENLNGYTIAIYPDDPALAGAFAEYFRWQWVCGLIKEDTADVYHELYDHFARRPDDLNRLHWR